MKRCVSLLDFFGLRCYRDFICIGMQYLAVVYDLLYLICFYKEKSGFFSRAGADSLALIWFTFIRQTLRSGVTFNKII